MANSSRTSYMEYLLRQARNPFMYKTAPLYEGHNVRNHCPHCNDKQQIIKKGEIKLITCPNCHLPYLGFI